MTGMNRVVKGLIGFIVVIALFIVLPLAGYSKNKKEVVRMTLDVQSDAFSQGGFIPSKYTCDGEDISPPLKWSKGPAETKSYAIIADDPDAPMGIWVHWVIYNIPSEITFLNEGIPGVKKLDFGALQGRNDFRKIGYGGPCPPGGTHRYFFKVYALDTVLNVGPGLTKSELLRKMEGHIIAQGELMGRYSR